MNHFFETRTGAFVAAIVNFAAVVIGLVAVWMNILNGSDGWLMPSLVVGVCAVVGTERWRRAWRSR